MVGWTQRTPGRREMKTRTILALCILSRVGNLSVWWKVSRHRKCWHYLLFLEHRIQIGRPLTMNGRLWRRDTRKWDALLKTKRAYPRKSSERQKTNITCTSDQLIWIIVCIHGSSWVYMYLSWLSSLLGRTTSPVRSVPKWRLFASNISVLLHKKLQWKQMTCVSGKPNFVKSSFAATHHYRTPSSCGDVKNKYAPPNLRVHLTFAWSLSCLEASA